MAAISLFDKKYTGGLDGAKGYDFEYSYILSQLSDWLKLPELEKLQQELLTDLEIFFRDGSRWFIQIKNHQINLSELDKILSDFFLREKTSEGQYKKYIIVSTGLSKSLATLKRHLDRFRCAQDYSPEELIASRQKIDLELKKNRSEDITQFIIDKLFFQSEVGWIHNEDAIRDRFVGSLVRTYEISPKSAEDLFYRTARLLSTERGKPIPLTMIRTAIEQKQNEDQKYQRKQFDLITDDFLARYKNEPSQSLFFDGAIPTWFDIVKNRDIPRELTGEILARIDQWKDGQFIVPVLADGGEGKSTLLRRLAFELSIKGKVVYFKRRDAVSLDVQEIERIADKVKGNFYLFIDDAASVQNFRDFVRGLSDLPFKFVMIVASRPYEWKSIRTSVSMTNMRILHHEKGREYILGDLTEREIKSLLQLLAKEGKIPALTADELDSAVEVCKRTSKQKLLVLMLELTKGKKAVEAIHDEIERVRTMGNYILSAYRYTCLMASVNSYLPISILKELVNYDGLELEVANRLEGLVELVSDKLYARHNKIGEIVTDLLFENAEGQRADALCRIITLAIRHGQIDAVRSLTWSVERKFLQSYQKILDHIIDESCKSGEYSPIKNIFVDIAASCTPELENLLIAVTPIIWDNVVFSDKSCTFIPDWQRIQDDWGICFRWFASDGKSNRNYNSKTSLEISLEWAQIYRDAAVWGSKDKIKSDFFGKIADKMYEILSEKYKEDSVIIMLQWAELLGDRWREEDAINLYKCVLEKDPNCAEAHLGLAEGFYLNGREIEALHHYRFVKKLNWHLVFYHGKEEIFEEMLQRFGLWEELIDLMKESMRERTQMHRRFFQSNIVKGMHVMQKLNGDKIVIREPKLMTESDVLGYQCHLDSVLKFIQPLGQEEKIEMGQQIFEKKWFGELAEQLSKHEI